MALRIVVLKRALRGATGGPDCVQASGSTFPLGETTVTCTASDAAHNTGSSSFKVTVSDTIKPTISAAISAGTPGSKGWYTGPVTVHFTCADTGSGIATCPIDQVLSSEGSSASTAQASTDNAGNTSGPSNVISVNIDSVKPAVAVTGVTNGASYFVGIVPAAGNACTDETSHVASSTGTTTGGDANGVGSLTYTAVCSDLAGNISKAAAQYTVNKRGSSIASSNVIQTFGFTAALRAVLSDTSAPASAQLGGKKG